MLLLAGRDIGFDRVSRLTDSRQIRQVLLRAIATVGQEAGRVAVRSVARSPAPSVRVALCRWPPASRSAPRLTATPAPLQPAHCSLAPDRRCAASGATPGR